MFVTIRIPYDNFANQSLKKNLPKVTEKAQYHIMNKYFRRVPTFCENVLKQNLI